MNRISFLVGILLALIVVIYLNCASAVVRDANGHIKRSQSAVNRFRATTICPATGVVSDKCPGYVVDHIIPLCYDGLDVPTNMQYQEYQQSLIKDRWERQICTLKRHPEALQ